MGYVIAAAFAAVFGLIIWFNHRLDRRLIAADKCPACAGAGAEWVHMNGLEGCFACDNTGTLTAHNRVRATLGWKPRS